MSSVRRILSLVVVAFVVFAAPGGAQQNLNIRVNVAQASYQALYQIPVMVSVIKDGAVFRQQESQLNSNVQFTVPAGVYDVRLEGAGMETLVKRGIQVLEGQTMDLIGGPMQAGAGIRIVEYAIGGLAREEVAARLAKLDSEVAALKAGLAALQAGVAELKRQP